jgi:hypothetical protein
MTKLLVMIRRKNRTMEQDMVDHQDTAHQEVVAVTNGEETITARAKTTTRSVRRDPRPRGIEDETIEDTQTILTEAEETTAQTRAPTEGSPYTVEQVAEEDRDQDAHL